MQNIRQPNEIYQVQGQIENGTFSGRWHYTFDTYYDPAYVRFGTLRVFNDDTLSPGAVWPLHPHRDIEVVTYCAEGEFRHADERGEGGILKKGWVQHTTVGSGMFHSEINNRPDVPMRFVQMWFLPSKRGLEPSLEQKRIQQEDRTNRLLPLVSNGHAGALPIRSDAQVYSSYLKTKNRVEYEIGPGRGVYLYVLEGEGIDLNGAPVPPLGAAQITDESLINVVASGDSEFLLVDVPMA